MRHFILSFWKGYTALKEHFQAIISSTHFLFSFDLLQNTLVLLFLHFISERESVFSLKFESAFLWFRRERERAFHYFVSSFEREHNFCFWKRAIELVSFPSSEEETNRCFGFGKSIILLHLVLKEKDCFRLVFRFRFLFWARNFRTHNLAGASEKIKINPEFLKLTNLAI